MTALRRLKVGRRTYEIRYRSFPKEYGWCVFNDQRIYLDDLSDGSQQAYAVIHESLHAIWYQKKLVDRPTEEKAVTELGWGLIELFRDNPGLATYIERLIGKER